MMVGVNISDEQLGSIADRTIQEADTNEDMCISFSEFTKVMPGKAVCVFYFRELSTQKWKLAESLLALRPSKMNMSSFFHRNRAGEIYHYITFTTSKSSAVNGCRQNESPNSW